MAAYCRSHIFSLDSNMNGLPLTLVQEEIIKLLKVLPNYFSSVVNVHCNSDVSGGEGHIQVNQLMSMAGDLKPVAITSAHSRFKLTDTRNIR